MNIGHNLYDGERANVTAYPNPDNNTVKLLGEVDAAYTVDMPNVFCKATTA